MSRHQLVKNIDLASELDDYDGFSDEDGPEELSPEDKGRISARLLSVLV